MKNSDLDRLATGLRSIISTNRCSFSNQDVDLLEEILSLLEELKNVEDQKSEAFQEKFYEIFLLLLKVFSNDQVLEILKDLLQ